MVWIHGFAAIVNRMLHDLPEPIPPRVAFGYLNDKVAAELFVANYFFKMTCRWCGACMVENSIGHFTCGGTIELHSCDSAEA
jgi:hypothetical protein